MSAVPGISQNQFIFEAADLVCPIDRATMVKVATLAPCGHSFNEESITYWLTVQPTCPLCKRPAILLPSQECLDKMVALVPRAAALQEACDRHRGEHPNEERSVIPRALKKREDAHILLDWDFGQLPQNRGLQLRVMRPRVDLNPIGGFTVGNSEMDATYSRTRMEPMPLDINPDPLHPTRISIRITQTQTGLLAGRIDNIIIVLLLWVGVAVCTARVYSYYNQQE